MPAAHIEPFHAGEPGAEFRFHGFQGLGQGVRILFAEGMKMKPLHALQQFRPELIRRDSQAASGGAGIV